jgi:mannose/fructose/N-acetylgalactosamine-specific phosphotransferase system component IIC
MIPPSIRAILSGALLILAVTRVAAQGASAPAAPSASQPSTAIAVSPKAAAEAAQKAVPRSDVGTVVKTGPTVADKVHHSSGSDKHRARRAHHPASAASSPDAR